MGFIVQPSGLVTVDHDLNDFAETTLVNNPVSLKTKNKPTMELFSVFLRRSHKDAAKTSGHSQNIGDNCPFIYALKRKTPGLFINKKTIKDLIPVFYEIIDKFIENQKKAGFQYDLIVPCPSSHPIAKILAKRVSRKANVTLIDSPFRKSTACDVEDILSSSSEIPRGDRVNIMNAVSKSREENRPFAVGDVRIRSRRYITPLLLDTDLLERGRILLVDDLVASGQTLIVARKVIEQKHPELSVDSLCLFSPVNNRLKKIKGI